MKIPSLSSNRMVKQKMRYREIEQLTDEDREKKILELKKELMELYAKVASGSPPENSGRLRQIKKDLARIFTSEHPKSSQK